jgi:threonine synthase
MVKQAFMDQELRGRLFLTSANSINVARWLPQQFYYFYALQQWPFDEPPVISVPSGNFGNLCAGLVAYKAGLPVKHFVAACNANDVVPTYFLNGEYTPQAAKATISNAMDVGDPSNFVRMLELFGHHYAELKSVISSYSIDDNETRTHIREVKKKFDYLLDPHGSVGYAAAKKYSDGHGGTKSIFLETAHPIKFYDVVEPVIGEKIPLPDSVKGIMDNRKVSTRISTYYTELKDFLLNR